MRKIIFQYMEVMAPRAKSIGARECVSDSRLGEVKLTAVFTSI